MSGVNGPIIAKTAIPPSTTATATNVKTSRTVVGGVGVVAMLYSRGAGVMAVPFWWKHSTPSNKMLRAKSPGIPHPACVVAYRPRRFWICRSTIVASSTESEIVAESLGLSFTGSPRNLIAAMIDAAISNAPVSFRLSSSAMTGC